MKIEEGIAQFWDKEKESHFWVTSRYSILLEVLKKELQKGYRLLEVGCGTGGFSALLSRSGYKVVSSDFDSGVLKIARKNVGDKVKFIQLDLEKERKGTYQGILAFDVLEHIKDDNCALRNLHAMLEPNGLFFFTVPAIPLFHSKWDEDWGHYRRYLPNELKIKLTKSGFTDIHLRYWNIIGIVSVIINKLLKTSHQDETIAKTPILNTLLYYWLLLENHLPLPFGLTLIGTARKA